MQLSNKHLPHKSPIFARLAGAHQVPEQKEHMGCCRWEGWRDLTPSDTERNRWSLINPEREALPAQVAKQPQLSQGFGFIVNQSGT